MSRKAFGKQPAGDRLKRIIKSPNYKEGIFLNIAPTSVNPNNVSLFKLLKDFASKPSTVSPSKELPFKKNSLLQLAGNRTGLTWFGHSSYLIQSRGINILVDPVLNGNASPVKLFGKSFQGADYYKAEHMPLIDILIVTHDHYDHLDMETVDYLRHKIKKVIAPLGLGEHLEYWGIERDIITELDWWGKYSISSDVEITATPARHFSGRGMKRAKTLWASYVLFLHGKKIFIGGDSGYDGQFKIMGKKFKSFDVALLECGQYGDDWPQIHMFPEQTVQAAKELHAKVLFPVHWAKFVLANHVWNEPIKRLVLAAQKEKQAFVSPMIGETYFIGEAHEQDNWWEFD